MLVVTATQEEIMYAIARQPIPPGQVTLYKALSEAGDHWLSKYELACQIRGGDEKSLHGVLGALGTRVDKTTQFKDSAPGVSLLIEIEQFHDEWHYRLRETARAAIAALPELRAAMANSVEEIHRQYEHRWLVVSC